MSDAENKYPSKTTADEYMRLAIQSDLLREDAYAMLARLGKGGGQSVLDLYCGTGVITDIQSKWVGANGTVVGADVDAAKLNYARKWVNGLGLSNASYVEANEIQTSLRA